VTGLRETASIARLAQLLLYLQAAVAAGSAALTWTRGLGEPLLPVEFTVWLVQVAAFVAAMAAMLIWLYRASANVRVLGASNMVVSPGLAVVWWFVPIANLVMPFQTVRELWKASANPADWEIERAPATTIWWWTFWLLAGIAGAIALRLSLEPDKEAAAPADAFLVASDLLYIPAVILVARIIAGIEAMQQRRRAGT